MSLEDAKYQQMRYNEHQAMKAILELIASGAIYGDNCRAIANTTLNELFVKPSANLPTDGEGS